MTISHKVLTLFQVPSIIIPRLTGAPGWLLVSDKAKDLEPALWI